MVRLGNILNKSIYELDASQSAARLHARAAQVMQRYKTIITLVYKDEADIILAHTNSVYILMKENVETLIVYVDESIFAADLNAQRELIRLLFQEKFSEDIQSFDIYVSRGDYRLRHPFIDEESLSPEKCNAVPLNEKEKHLVEQHAQMVENPAIREALKKAMTADLEWKKGKKEKNFD